MMLTFTILLFTEKISVDHPKLLMLFNRLKPKVNISLLYVIEDSILFFRTLMKKT